MNDPDTGVLRGERRIVVWAAASAAVGVIALLVGAVVAPRQALFAYFTAFHYLVSLAAGALVFLMICHAMHAGWPTLLRRLNEAIVATLPLCALLFVPVLAGLPTLFPWVHPETIADAHTRHVIALRGRYLSPGWFVWRTVIYFAVWILAGLLLRRWSRAQDRAVVGRGGEPGHRMYVLSGVLLPPVALSLSFAAFDWVMSLTPAWASTMFPIRYFAGGFVSALALLTVLTWAADRAALIRGINDSHYYALGRLLLAFVIFWAYAEYFQLLLMWSADKPDEVTFYLARLHGGWAAVSVILVLAQFVVPFFALLSHDLKQRRDRLAAVAAWLLVAHYVDVHWLVMPAARPEGAPYRWIDLGALLAVGGVSVLYGVFRARGAPLVPLNDPALAEARRYESS